MCTLKINIPIFISKNNLNIPFTIKYRGEKTLCASLAINSYFEIGFINN